MQNKQLKRPYFPPEITAVEFRVERGLETSGGTQLPSGYWEAQTMEDANYLMFQMQMDQQNGAYNQNSYFGDPTTGNWGSSFWN